MSSYTYELAELGDDAHGLGCNCCRFQAGTDLPTPTKLTREEIATLSTAFATSIIRDWTRLNAIVKRFESVIQKRWLKKATKQRRALLLQAWPDMSKDHRPDFASFRKHSRFAPRSRTCPSAAYLWPYINLEDLQQHHFLLLFINSRGRIMPEAFAAADLTAAHLGHGWEMCMHDLVEAAYFVGRRTPRSYGACIDLRVGLLISAEVPFHPMSGLLALEIQKEIYGFLVRCAELILHDVDPRQFLLAPHQPPPSVLDIAKPRSTETSTGFETKYSLTTHQLETPYRAPQGMDLERVKMLVAARRSAAEDHIWSLREDPAYFVNNLTEWKEHDIEYIRHEVKHNCTQCWGLLAGRMIKDASNYFLFWDDVHRRIQAMPSLEAQLKRADRLDLRLHKQDERLWVELQALVGSMITLPIDRIQAGWPVSPRIRHCYNWEAPFSSLSERWYTKSDRQMSNDERRLHLVFLNIADPDKRSLHGLRHLVSEAQYIFDTEPAAAQLVDPWMMEHFADLALLTYLETTINGFEPWASSWVARDVLGERAVYTAVDKSLALTSLLRKAIPDACAAQDCLGDPFSRMYDYPVDKAFSVANMKQMRVAEQALDRFWGQVDEGVDDVAGTTLLNVLEQRVYEQRVMYRTPSFTVTKVSGFPSTEAPLRQLNINVPRVFGCEAAEQPSTLKRTKNQKVKTRGTPARSHPMSPEALVAAAELADPPPPPAKIYQVNKRTYKVMSALLPSVANADQHQRFEIDWTDFCYALNAIGLQPEKLYGSV